MAKKAKTSSKRPAIGFHQAGLAMWKKELKGKSYDKMPRGFRAEFTAKMVKALGCSESSAQTYVQHYARHGSAKWDYQAATAPRYVALRKGNGKAAKAKNGSKVKYTPKGKKAAKAARAAA